MLALAPLAVVVLAPVVVAVIWRWRYVSLGSITGALLAPVVTGVLAAIGAVRSRLSDMRRRPRS
jgi:glycerol-3-phosphate acyltransferase PlsY